MFNRKQFQKQNKTKPEEKTVTTQVGDPLGVTLVSTFWQFLNSHIVDATHAQGHRHDWKQQEPPRWRTGAAGWV